MACDECKLIKTCNHRLRALKELEIIVSNFYWLVGFPIEERKKKLEVMANTLLNQCGRGEG